MVVLGVLFGIMAFCLQGFTKWDGTSVPVSMLLVGTLLSLFMIPAPASLDVRGNPEIFPLNGPHWSLFFEYLGSILYAVLIVRVSTKNLQRWVSIAALALLSYTLFCADGHIGVGWSSEPKNLLGGALRLLFAYPMGMLLARKFREERPRQIRKPIFLLSGIALALLLAVPSFSWLTAWKNANVWYQIIYLYIHWINTDSHPFGPYAWSTPVALFVIAGVLATVSYKFYDEPLRRILTRWFTTISR